MNSNDRPGVGEGERLHAERRRRFWYIIAGIGVLGMLTGMFGSMIFDFSGGQPGSLSPAATSLAVVALAASVLLFAYGSWRFFATVDEVELADNLWGSLIGFYAYAILFPAWWALHKLEQAPEPDDWTIFTVAMVTAMLAYAFRKWRSR